MCRLLAIRNVAPFDPAPHLRGLARVAQTSREYQGHGWGCARWVPDSGWQLYHNIMPIWQDDLSQFNSTTFLIAHARSAFRDEGICVENNMPFADAKYAFAFNGELHGVRIKEQGRIGAEKVFNYIKRFDRGDMRAAIRKGMDIIERRTRRLRAMNLIIGDGKKLHIGTLFRDDPEYFTMHRTYNGDAVIVCSQPYETDSGWQPIANNSVLEL